MTRSKLELGGVALVLATGGTAFAQAPGDPAPANQAPTQTQPAPAAPDDSCPLPTDTCPPTQPVAQPMPVAEPVPTETESGTQDWLNVYGLGFSVGGGVDDFSGTSARNQTGTGGSWTARVTLGTKYYVAGEISYIGSAQSVTALGLASNTELIGNGAQAALRLNGTIDYPVQPFIYGGAAWRYYSLNTNATNLSDIANNANAFEIPVGAGLAAYADGFMFDVRGEYRFAWTDHTLIPEADGGNSLMDRWGVTGNLGYTF